MRAFAKVVLGLITLALIWLSVYDFDSERAGILVFPAAILTWVSVGAAFMSGSRVRRR